jgi:hypothetical protein
MARKTSWAAPSGNVRCTCSSDNWNENGNFVLVAKFDFHLFFYTKFQLFRISLIRLGLKIEQIFSVHCSKKGKWRKKGKRKRYLWKRKSNCRRNGRENSVEKYETEQILRVKETEQIS